MRLVKFKSVNSKLKAFVAVSSLVLVCGVVHLYFNQNDGGALKFFKETSQFMDALNATECKLPEYDIYDPQIKPYIEAPPSAIRCGFLQPYLTYMDWDGMLYLNETEAKIHNYRDKGPTCFYDVVTIDPKDDYAVKYTVHTYIKSFPQRINYPVIKVTCSSAGKQIYVMIHSQILPIADDRIEENRKIPIHRPSVLIFGIDSISRGNFIRSLPLTHDYLVKKLSMTVFKGLNKVADNTCPNMMALLAGYMRYFRKDMEHVPVWTPKKNSSINKYDDMPIVWKTLQKAGYFTYYAEEYLDSIFSFLDVGFRDDPVDYYYRSTYVAMKHCLPTRHTPWDRSTWMYCMANEPSFKFMLNNTEEFITEMAGLRYFALSFFVEMSHEYLNDVKNMDKFVLEFFQRMFENGYFNNTVVIMMGDHGHRFDDIRTTFIGRIEERMPFLGILLPESLKQSHPHLQKGLSSHTERLLSWYDIHQMLVDITEDDLGEKSRRDPTKTVGRSIFRPFTENRTCTQIGILPEYCMCDREADIPPNSEKAIDSANIVVDYINLLLKTSVKFLRVGEERSCATLSLKVVKSASASLQSFSAQLAKSAMRIRVMLEVEPSNALFEAVVEHKANSVPTILGDVNRVNKYGDQPSCISHQILRLYCYCTSSK